MSVKAIIFDFGQVLNVAQNPTEARERRRRLADRLNIPSAELWPYLFEGEAAKKWMTGRLSWDEFWQAVLEPRGIIDPDEREAFAREVLADSRDLHPEMVSLLYELRGRYKLAILSNASWTEEELRTKLREEHHLPEGIFDTVVTSNSAGSVKPQAMIFSLALERLGVQPHEAIFTDDLVSFTNGAARLGLRTHTFTTPAEFRRYLVKEGVLDQA